MNFLIKKNLTKGSMKLINKSEFEDLKKNIKIEKIVAGGFCCKYYGWISLSKWEIHLLLEKLILMNLEILYKKSLEEYKCKFSLSSKKMRIYLQEHLLF